MSKDSKIFKFLFTLPVVIYSLMFIAVPLLYIFVISFFKSDYYGGMIHKFTLENYVELFQGAYVKIFLTSIIIGLITTFICILIAYPFVLAVTHKSKKVQELLMTLVMVPFLTNALIRMYGWIVLLRKYGVVNQGLISLRFLDKPLSLMYNDFGIILGMVYTLLPFMILPLYSSVSTIDKSLLEAASDLGASKIKTFFNIILPQSFSGLFNGALMVFTPALGYFFIVDVLGGGKVMILGNLIKNQFLTARNWPFGAAISVFLILITTVLIWLYKKSGGKMDELSGV